MIDIYLKDKINMIDYLLNEKSLIINEWGYGFLVEVVQIMTALSNVDENLSFIIYSNDLDSINDLKDMQKSSVYDYIVGSNIKIKFAYDNYKKYINNYDFVVFYFSEYNFFVDAVMKYINDYDNGKQRTTFIISKEILSNSDFIKDAIAGKSNFKVIKEFKE